MPFVLDVKNKYKLIAALKKVTAVKMRVSAYDENAEKWVRTSNPKFRAKIQRQEDNIKWTLDHISKNTKVKKDKDGRNLYLLHRGMSLEEFIKYFKPKEKEEFEDYGAEAVEYGVVIHATNAVKYTKNSSWSLDKEMALGFSHERGFGNCGICVSAWILEDAIIYGIIDESAASWEKEIIVGKGLITNDFSYQRGKTERESFAKRTIQELKKRIEQQPNNNDLKEELKYYEKFAER